MMGLIYTGGVISSGLHYFLSTSVGDFLNFSLPSAATPLVKKITNAVLEQIRLRAVL